MMLLPGEQSGLENKNISLIIFESRDDRFRLLGVYFARSGVATVRRQVAERTTLSTIQYMDQTAAGQSAGSLTHACSTESIYQGFRF